MPTTSTRMTEPQQQHLRRVKRLGTSVVQHARRAMAGRTEAADAAARLADVNGRHPHYVDMSIRHRTWMWLLLGSLGAAVVLEQVLTAPVAEHLLRHYAKFGAATAGIWKWVASGFVCVWELGFAVQRERATDEERKGQAIGWGLVSMLPITVMFVLVGLTQHAVDRQLAVDSAIAANIDPTTLPAAWSPLVTIMMLFTAGVHLWVAFGPHADTLAYTSWSLLNAWHRGRQQTGADADRHESQAAGDRFADYAAERDAYVAAYPGWPVPPPNWSEAAQILREVYGYDVIVGPNGGGAMPPAGAPLAPSPAATTATDVPPATRPDAPPHPGAAEAPRTEADALREILARRVKDSDGEVTA